MKQNSLFHHTSPCILVQTGKNKYNYLLKFLMKNNFIKIFLFPAIFSFLFISLLYKYRMYNFI